MFAVPRQITKSIVKIMQKTAKILTFFRKNVNFIIFLIILKVPEQFAVFEAVVILQMIAYFTSTGKGLNADQPRNLAKSVTVE